MGCCLSRSTTPPPPNPTPLPKLHNDASRRRHPRPPPPPLLLEEETVKEVLTETPFTVLDARPNETIQAKEGIEVIEVKQKQQQHGNGIEDFKTRSVDVEVSEITVATENRSATAASVSVSESVSAVTAGAGGEEVMSKSRDRPELLIHRRQQTSISEQSPAKVSRRRPYSGELTVNGPREKRVRSPAKKAVPSPEKKTNLAHRPNRGRSQSPATSNNRNASINAGPARIRRDAGERSGRRSRSPARNAFQCTSSTSRTGPSSEVNAGVNSVQSQQGEVRKTGTVGEDEGRCAVDESLDNPLVSLECFIFL